MMSKSRRKPGPLGPYVEGYRAWLLELGYAPLSVTRSLTALGHLGGWTSPLRKVIGEALSVQIRFCFPMNGALSVMRERGYRKAR